MFCIDDKRWNRLYPSEQPSRGFAREPQQSAFKEWILYCHVTSGGTKVLMKMADELSPEDIVYFHHFFMCFTFHRSSLSLEASHHLWLRVTYFTKDFSFVFVSLSMAFSNCHIKAPNSVLYKQLWVSRGFRCLFLRGLKHTLAFLKTQICIACSQSL